MANINAGNFLLVVFAVLKLVTMFPPPPP